MNKGRQLIVAPYLIMKKSLLLLLIIHLSISLLAGWERTYRPSDYNVGYCVQETIDGGYIVVGVYDRAWAFGRGLVLLIKTDEYGDTIWTTTYGGSNYDEGNHVLEIPDDGYLIAGTTFSFGSSGADVYLLKTDCHGQIEWTKTYGTMGWDASGTIIKTTDGAYMLAAVNNYGLAPHEPGKAWLLKIDERGDTLWTRTYGDRYNDFATSVINTSDGGYVFTGRSDSSGVYSSADVYVVKTNDYGDTLWSRLYGGSDTDAGYAIVEVGDDGYAIAGLTRSFGAGEEDGFLIRITNHGDTLWTKTYGGVEPDEFKSMQITSDSCFILAGTTTELSTSYVWLLKTDILGNEIWSRRFHKTSPYGSYGEYVSLTSDGGYVITGRHSTQTSPIIRDVDDVYLIKTDSLGYCSIEEIPNYSVPKSLSLAAYPNPFNSAVTIAIDGVGDGSPVPFDVEIYDVNGRIVDEMTVGATRRVARSTGQPPVDPYKFIWQPDKSLPSGVYLVRARVGGRGDLAPTGQAATKRIVYLK